MRRSEGERPMTHIVSTFMHRRITLVLLAWMCHGARSDSLLYAQSDNRPAEQSRLSTSTFRNGLKKRGLTEVLELHLKDFPPATETARLSSRREILLTKFNEHNRPALERREAIALANDLLAELIATKPDDRRRFDWRFELAHSLIYLEAEPYFTSILYRGGSNADRQQLQQRTQRALRVLSALQADLDGEYERVDNLEIRHFERLEKSGYIDQLDRLPPRMEYLLLWTLLYDALSRSDSDARRRGALERLVRIVGDNDAIITTPHSESRVQVQALLLVGMANRLLNKHDVARQHLKQAVAVAGRVEDDQERERVAWAVNLAHIERIRNERDDGRMEFAQNRLKQFRQSFGDDSTDHGGLTLVAALLQRSIYKEMARTAREAGSSSQAKFHETAAWQAMQRFVQRAPHRRDEVYATVFDLVGAEPDVDSLDPFERCAVVAGLLLDADLPEQEIQQRLDRAIQIGGDFVNATPAGAESLLPEVLYNVAVALYRRGRIPDAARQFLQVAHEHAGYVNAPAAAEYAAQLASSIANDPANVDRPDAQQLYFDALHTLVDAYPETTAAKYWLFFHAQILEDRGELRDAATQYARVDESHEHYLDSLLFRLRSLSKTLDALPDDNWEEIPIIKEEFLTASREFPRKLKAFDPQVLDEPTKQRLKRLAALAGVIDAEFRMLPVVDRPQEALQTLEHFEESFADQKNLLGRVWRVRLLAFEKLGRIDRVRDAILQYPNADKENYAATFQQLYFGLVRQIKILRNAGEHETARPKAEIALRLAQELYDKADGEQADNRRAMHKQLALALLEAGQVERAVGEFERLGMGGASLSEQGPAVDVDVLFGYAEALYALERYNEALPRFNELATKLRPKEDLRWRALLLDLKCRTKLGQEPAAIIQVIEQQKFLYPDMGGPERSKEFDELHRRSQRRRHGG